MEGVALSEGHRLISCADGLTEMVNAVRDAGTVAVDFETDGLAYWNGDHPIGYALGYWSDGPRAFYVPVEAQRLPQQKAAFRDALTGADALVGHNLKFDLNMGRANGWDIPKDTPLHDTMVQAHLIDENRRFALEKVVAQLDCSPYGEASELKDAVNDWITKRARSTKVPKTEYLNKYGHAEVPIPLESEYSCRDIGHTLALHRRQYDLARGIGTPHERRRAVLYTNEMLLVRALADMEFNGQLVDAGYLRRVAAQLDTELADHAGELERGFGVSIEWSNNNQVRDLLFSHLGLPITGTTKGGAASVDRQALLTLQSRHPAIPALLRWRTRQKVRSTYTDSLLDRLGPDNRIHASFVQTGTATGRLSSRHPNLQNIPSRDPELSAMIRRAFVVGDGAARIYIDYSQVELRMLAWISGSPALTAAYESAAYNALLRHEVDYATYRQMRESEDSTDVHGLVANRVFRVSPGDADYKAKRNASKIINFGVPYGGGPRLLSNNPQLRLSEAEARSYLHQYHAQNPEIERVKARLLDSMRSRKDLSFTNWASRKRHGKRLVWRRARNGDCPVAEEERSMFASLVQGSAGELTRFSLVRLWLLQQGGQLPGITTSTIHDEIQLDCDAKDIREVAEIAQREMEAFTGLFGAIPIVADVEYTTTNWSEKKGDL